MLAVELVFRRCLPDVTTQAAVTDRALKDQGTTECENVLGLKYLVSVPSTANHKSLSPGELGGLHLPVSSSYKSPTDSNSSKLRLDAVLERVTEL